MKSHLIIFICGLLILLFLYTGLSKFLDFHGFMHDLDNQPFPNRLTPYLAWGLPSLEILIAICLLFDSSRLVGLVVSLLLLLLFTVYTAVVLLHGFDRVPCSCGGVIRQLSWGQHLVFNLVFTALSIMGLLIHTKIHVSERI